MYIEENDYECPQCFNQLQEDINEDGKRYRYCEECGKSYFIDEEDRR